MKIPRAPHRWSVTPKQAIAIQKQLAPAIREQPLRGPVRLIAGADLAFTPDGSGCIAAVVIWDVVEQNVVEQQVTVHKVAFPYVPGLLSFREAPAVIATLRRLRHTPDALIYDGHGRSHPRRIGIASHVGLLAGIPTVGCAKSRLVGTHGEPGKRRGSRTALCDGDEILGTVLRTRTGVKPVFVSVGHNVDLASAEKLVLDCAVGFRLPEPTRLADRLVAAVKRDMVA